MNNFIFENTTKAYFGKGCVKEYLACQMSRYRQNVMLCYGGGSIKRNGVYDEVRGILESCGKHVIEFSGIPSNPTYAKVLEGAKLAKAEHADMILAVGGGSVMDAARRFRWRRSPTRISGRSIGRSRTSSPVSRFRWASS